MVRMWDEKHYFMQVQNEYKTSQYWDLGERTEISSEHLILIREIPLFNFPLGTSFI